MHEKHDPQIFGAGGERVVRERISIADKTIAVCAGTVTNYTQKLLIITQQRFLQYSDSTRPRFYERDLYGRLSYRPKNLACG